MTVLVIEKVINEDGKVETIGIEQEKIIWEEVYYDRKEGQI